MRQAVANVAMFIPLGTLGPRALRLTFRSLVVSALAFSVLIETLQFALETGRATDVNDVIANLLGALLGAVVFELILRRFTAGSVDPAQPRVSDRRPPTSNRRVHQTSGSAAEREARS